MSIKRVLNPINGRDDIAPVAHLAFDIARIVGAEVEVLHPFRPYYDVVTAVGDGGSPRQITRELQNAKTQFEQENIQARKLYDELVTANPDVKTAFVELSGRASEVVTQRAFSSDLIVLGNAATFDSEFWRDVYDGALIHSTRPVLIAPTNARLEAETGEFASELLVAWGGTAESARALTAAEPFFASAKEVRVLTISNDQRKIDTAEQMKEYARLHGANASVTIVNPDHKDIAQTLLSEASAKPGTLLVMGAYSHARWRERIFGGVTEHVLHHAEVPILMAH